MTTELKYLAWTLVLALVQIAITATLRTLETGLPYNAGPRDVPSPVRIGKITGRFARAQANLLETLPIFAAAVLAAHLAQVHSKEVLQGVMLYFWARVFYVPAYALGVPYVRTVIWAVSLVGIVRLISSLF